MKKITIWGCASGLALLLNALPASATTIGSFAYLLDPNFGPVFQITNDSDLFLGSPGGTFLNGELLVFDSANALVDDLTISDPILSGPDNALQLSSSLFELVNGYATLNLNFSIPGAVSIAPLNGLIISFDPDSALYSGTFTDPDPKNSVFIDFTPDVPPSPVPEPATVFLLAPGLALLIRARSRTKSANRRL